MPRGGQSRHAKGVNLVGMVKFLRARRRDQSLTGLPEAAERMLDQRILLTAWYPLEDVWALVRYVYEMAGSDETKGVELGNLGGREMWSATHRSLVSSSDVGRTLRFMPAGWGQYFDFGSLAVEHLDERSVRFTVQGYSDCPACHGTTIAGWHLAAAQLAGWPDARVELEARTWRGDSELIYCVHAQ